MKNLFGLLLFILSFNAYAEFLHPLDYMGTPEQDKLLEEYISEQVKKESCTMSKEMCEKKMKATKDQELKAFHKLVKATDRNKIDNLIKMWCSTDDEPCYYDVISMMHKN